MRFKIKIEMDYDIYPKGKSDAPYSEVREELIESMESMVMNPLAMDGVDVGRSFWGEGEGLEVLVEPTEEEWERYRNAPQNNWNFDLLIRKDQ